VVASLLLGVGCAPKRATPAPAAAIAASEEVIVKHAWLDRQVHRVDVGGTGLAYMDTGGDGPVVLLVHGLGSTSSFWEYQLDSPLGDELRLIAVDLPGWGRSDQPDGPYTPSWYAEHLVELLDAFGLERATVAGHSMGGQAAIHLALAHPERVERLVLVAPAGIETFTAEESAFLGSFWTVDKLRDRPPAEARLAFSFVFADLDDGVERLLAERLAVDGTPRFDGLARAVIRSVQGMLDEPVRQRLGELSMPTLVVFGEADVMIPNRALHPGATVQGIADEARAAIPDVEVVLIPGAGHTPHHDEPEAFTLALRRFLGLGEAGEP
jgi:pimeloyl-ACP methyl ester carboxylesterase